MPVLESIMDLLNGSHGAAVYAGIRQAFLICLAVAVAALAFAPRPPGRKHFWLLAGGIWLGFAGVLAYQAAWQLAGFRRPEFVRFMRFHDPRPDAAVRQMRRGTIFDWRGTVLASSDTADQGIRLYPLGPAASHVVGYSHPRYGVAGVERAADATLCGYSFANLSEIDRFGRNLLDHRATGGGDVRLTLDAELQLKAYGLLAGRHGAVVALRPTDGALLVLASAPGFDPRRPEDALADTLNAPLLNRAVQGLYPPGSVFKILVAGLAIENRMAPTFRCPAEGFIPSRGARPIRDSEYYAAIRTGSAWSGHGRVNLRYGFVHSSNVYFAQLALALGAPAFNTLAARGQVNEHLVFFDGAAGNLATAAGHLPAVAVSSRQVQAQLAIGQGELVVTPLHVALWTAAVAAGGEMWQPRLRADAPPRRLGRAMSAAAAATVRDLMREAVMSGTGRTANVPGLRVCGKTGTAEAPGGGEHAWFTCFAPVERPELVVTVLIERGGYGARAAAPVARAVLQEAEALGLVGGDPRTAEPAR